MSETDSASRNPSFSKSNWIYILYDTTIEREKDIYPEILHAFLGQTELWDLGVVVSDVYGRHSGYQCAAGAGWLDRYYDYGCLVEIQQNSPELEDEFPFGIRVIRTTMCVTISVCEKLLPTKRCHEFRGWKFATCELRISQDRMRLREVRPEHIATSCNRVRESRWKRLVVVSSVSFVIWPHTIGQVWFLLQITSRSLLGQILKGTLTLLTIL